MDIRIDNLGVLYIKRAREFVKTYCPYNQDSGACACYCPLFGEPKIQRSEYSDLKRKDGILELCIKTIHFDTLIDERQ